MYVSSVSHCMSGRANVFLFHNGNCWRSVIKTKNQSLCIFCPVSSVLTLLAQVTWAEVQHTGVNTFFCHHIIGSLTILFLSHIPRTHTMPNPSTRSSLVVFKMPISMQIFISSFHCMYYAIILYHIIAAWIAISNWNLSTFKKCAVMTAAVISASYKRKWLRAECLISQWKDLGCLLCMESQVNSTKSKEDFICVSPVVMAFPFTCHKCPYKEFRAIKGESDASVRRTKKLLIILLHCNQQWLLQESNIKREMKPQSQGAKHQLTQVWRKLGHTRLDKDIKAWYKIQSTNVKKSAIFGIDV